MSEIISAITLALNNYIDKLYSTFIEDQRYMLLVEGLGNTLIIALGALVIGVVIGSVIAIAKYFAEDEPRLRAVKWLCDTYTTVIRGIPWWCCCSYASFWCSSAWTASPSPSSPSA